MPDWHNEIRRRLAPLGLAPGNSRGSALAALTHDVRFAVRALRANLGFTTVALLTLALSIGACTLIFSAVHGVLLRPLPYRESGQLVAFWGTAPEKNLPVVAFPDGLFYVYHEQSRTLESLAAYDVGGFNFTATGEAERLEGASVTLDFFRVFGVSPLLGRTFVAGEDAGDVGRVVLSHTLWMRRFGGRADIVGKTIDLSSTPSTVVGVMPAGFDFPNRSELWVPLYLDRNAFNCWCYPTVGRMRARSTPEQVRREIETITDDFSLRRRDVFPDAKKGGAHIVAVRLAEQIVGNLERPLLVLFAAVGAVLLIACANTANLMLARAAARTREMAVRCCLGASPWRIAAQLLTESVLLSLAGAMLGAVVAVWGVHAMRALPPEQFPRMSEVALDPVVLSFTTGVALFTSILCGLAPALRASRVDLQDVLKAGTRSTATTGARRLRDAFVVAQFALSLVLLVGAGLLLRSYRHLLQIDPGYRPQHVLVARLTAPYPRYGSDTAVRRFYGQLLDRLAAVPGFRRVALASRVPLTPFNPQNNLIAEGREPKPGEPVLVANIRSVTPDYFDAIGTPLLQGRLFEPTDDEHHPRVAVVDESLARHFWPTESALGKRIRYGGDTTATRWMTIVGIVRNVKHNSLDEKPDLQVYEPFVRAPWRSSFIVVRTEVLPPESIVAQLRREVAALDATIPLFEVRTMQRAIDQSLSTRRLTNVLLAAFALAALILAAIGIYGVISLNVTGRLKEFGIRLALGARSGDVTRLVLRQGMLLAVAGVTVGLLGAVFVTRFLRVLLFGVQPLDWPTFGAVALLLSATALAACWVPARRAMRSDPIEVLRTE